MENQPSLGSLGSALRERRKSPSSAWCVARADPQRVAVEAREVAAVQSQRADSSTRRPRHARRVEQRATTCPCRSGGETLMSSRPATA